MKRLRLLAAAASLATLAACDLSVTSLPLPGGADLGDNPFTVKVEFRDVLDLVPQSSVKVDDVTVGRVEDIELKGYTALVTLKVRGDVDLPGDAVAEIRQTSLLGEKFVQLAEPESGGSSEKLGEGDVIPLDRSGRNPEVEEVLGALSLVLNGGGVAQLKTIATEVNNALEGRESDVKSAFRRITAFLTRIDDNKGAIVTALARVSELSKSLNAQEQTLDIALDNLPQALSSIDRQRDDLVKMLRALAELGDVGTRVIQQSKAATIDSLEALAPTLAKLAEAGDDFPRSLELALTFPFPDAVVGRSAQQARDFHMGDYTNLSVQMEIDLRNGLPNPPGLPGGLSLPELLELCADSPLDPLCKQLGNQTLPPLDLPLPDLGLPTVAPPQPRSAPGIGANAQQQPTGSNASSELGALLVWGMVSR
ncbi:MAG TPA: MCE family protein [Nocardioidaceae bacterium]|nr:MCE family protein [Nocardioidaceae bacterium]